ncbi:hypothetical protein sos41_16340 [Alphaproteobacteria bacterium SO-S41]|nr:hypothetical protein sos41_16340 [Alphaproteobacteria bacterium SO-S41]
MAGRAKSGSKAGVAVETPPLAVRLQAALDGLAAKATRHDFENLMRFGITAPNALGVSMANMRVLAKPLGRDHALAEVLWATGLYEARMLATLIDDPAAVTPAQMERWCKDFDNWAICDTACFALFDRVPHASAKIAVWAKRKDEFQKRAAFALLACMALHRKEDADAPYLDGLKLIEREAGDARNFVKKGVNWALRGIGGRRSAAVRAAARATAERLANSKDATARWNGKDALRAFAKADAKPKRLKP